MVILGTPQVTLGFGIPDWLVFIILVGLIFTYLGIKKVHLWYVHRHDDENLSSLDHENFSSADS